MSATSDLATELVAIGMLTKETLLALDVTERLSYNLVQVISLRLHNLLKRDTRLQLISAVGKDQRKTS